MYIMYGVCLGEEGRGGAVRAQEGERTRDNERDVEQVTYR